MRGSERAPLLPTLNVASLLQGSSLCKQDDPQYPFRRFGAVLIGADTIEIIIACCLEAYPGDAAHIPTDMSTLQFEG